MNRSLILIGAAVAVVPGAIVYSNHAEKRAAERRLAECSRAEERWPQTEEKVAKVDRSYREVDDAVARFPQGSVEREALTLLRGKRASDMSLDLMFASSVAKRMVALQCSPQWQQRQERAEEVYKRTSAAAEEFDFTSPADTEPEPPDYRPDPYEGR